MNSVDVLLNFSELIVNQSPAHFENLALFCFVPQKLSCLFLILSFSLVPCHLCRAVLFVVPPPFPANCFHILPLYITPLPFNNLRMISVISVKAQV